LEAARLAATRSAAAQNTYLTKRLNIWVSAGTAYFNMLSWHNKCRVTRSKLLLEDFYEQPVYISLDLASKVDIAAKIMLFRDENRIRYVFGKYYLPESALEKGNPNYDFYIGWYKQGLIDVTDGDMIDFEHIEDDLLLDRNQFSVKAVAYDPFQADELSMRMLKEGLPMVKVVPSVKNYSESMKLIDGLIRGGNIKHNGDPVLEWMMGNVTAHKDFKQNIYPRQVRDESKIDGAVALIAAARLDLAMMGEDEEIYQDRGLRTL
jgi:phage terminase large subunit-like protein